MEKLRITTVCGFGVGSSLVLKMQLDDVLKAMGVPAEVCPSDVTSVVSSECDMIFTSREFYEQLKDTQTVPVIPVGDFLDKAKLMETTKAALESWKA